MQEEGVNGNKDDSSEDDSLIVAFQYMRVNDNQTANGQYSDTEILLDTGSTMSVFKNKKSQ